MEPHRDRTRARIACLTSLGASVRSCSDLTRPESWALLAVVGIGLAAHLVQAVYLIVLVGSAVAIHEIRRLGRARGQPAVPRVRRS